MGTKKVNCSPAVSSNQNREKPVSKRPVTFRPNLPIGMTLSYFNHALADTQSQLILNHGVGPSQHAGFNQFKHKKQVFLMLISLFLTPK